MGNIMYMYIICCEIDLTVLVKDTQDALCFMYMYMYIYFAVQMKLKI